MTSILHPRSSDRRSDVEIIPFPGAVIEASPQSESSTGRVVLDDPLRGEARVLVAASDSLLNAITKAKRIARSKTPVLIQGETGTGKELIARLIHENSPRRDKELVQVNCAAFSEALIESELFGHEKGAFTGADQRHSGYFERADGGSILLDEIGEMPLKLQAKLLRVLEEETFERVGGEQLVKVDVRIIATTNRNLESEASERHFRSDLLYRLNAMTLYLPPLRARVEEIPHLVQIFIERFGAEGSVPVRTISARALQLLQQYAWPGNIRQLRNVVQHACVFAQGCQIEVQDLPPLTHSTSKTVPLPGRQTLAEIERQTILETLREVGGNRTAAALRLGVTTRTLQNKLKLYREEIAA
jgi:transcriptional regulator with PAS, ATPase and Fis domain